MEVINCFGVVVVFKDKNENKFLLLQQDNRLGSWTFPKGHRETNEEPIETALRELKEESGIEKVELLDFPLIREEYEVTKKGNTFLKVNQYYIGFVYSQKVIIQDGEIYDYKWATYTEAINTFLSFQKTRIDVLKEVNRNLNSI